MAEKRFIKGLFKDTAHLDQPEATWRHARNMLLNSTDGAVSNEGGTELSGHLGTNTTTGAIKDKVIGAIEVNNDKVILFIVDVVDSLVGTGTAPRSEIGIWENGSYNMLYNPNPTTTVDLNFRESNPIEGTFKIDSKGDLIIYWTDDLNPPRAFNVDRQLRDSTGISNLYGISSLNSINLLNLFPYSGLVPTIRLGEVFPTLTGPIPTLSDPIFQTSVHTGGGLRTGAYHLALAYVDKDEVATGYVSISSPVSIVAEFDAIRPTTKKDGDKEGTQTSKAISWQISDVNLDYKYIRPVVIRKMGDATEAFKLNDLQIDLNDLSYMIVNFSGIEGVTPASVEDVIIDTISYETAKTINQLDGVLYIGNLTGSKDVGFQKYANNIKLRSKLYKIDKFEAYWATADGLQTGFGNSPVDEGNSTLEDRSYKYVPNSSNYRGYQRDEVYAFYIAFIMNDGSMSYAYHIPGREAITTGIPYGDYFTPSGRDSELQKSPGSLRDSYSKTAKMYQFYDATTLMPASATRVMQYWENQNEFYPANDDYEVWDDTDTKIGNIQGLNVRHHHFPSNENSSRSSVSSTDDSVVIASSSEFADYDAIANNHYQGQFRVSASPFIPADTNWHKVSGSTIYTNTPNASAIGIAPPVSSGIVTATTNNTVIRVMPHLRMFNNGSASKNPEFRVLKYSITTGSWAVQGHYGLLGGCCEPGKLSTNGNNYKLKVGAGGGLDDRVFDPKSYTWAISCNAGEKVKVEWKSSKANKVELSGSGGTNWGSCSYGGTSSLVKYNITINTNPIDLADYRDVKISQEARALGFRLTDIHIPQTIADRVQGFRIFRSKRDHADRTILGQSVGIPMQSQFGVIGLCNEAAASPNAMQNLSVTSGREDFFLNKTPWSDEVSKYTGGYKHISFHDFYLLRTKNSLTPATHLKIEYIVRDYVWNGPDIEQDKKMLSEIDTTSGTTSDSGAYTVTERWGWDNPSNVTNCYSQYANSAIFMGGRYFHGSTLTSTMELNRALGQKAKTYVLGDSIFGAEALGFGGKIVNLGGESHIALGLEDGSEILPLLSKPDLSGSGIASSNMWNVFGLNRPDSGPMLVGGPSGTGGGNRHESYILNLKAYKTDVYKSIDSNDLVFTGFEVKGEDLNNFIIGGTYNSANADYATDTVQSSTSSVLYESDDNRRGIFGGDIFLSRYGFAAALSPKNTEQFSNPLKAVYSHIVESSDNISLRHSESKESEYFPNTPAREMLKMVGTEKGDFTHQDNMKYNKNYSTTNDIKPAFPLPVKGRQTDFPTRTHRSAKNDTTSLIDNYRIFLANQFKDLPKNRGDLWKLSSFNNLLYFHMEESLYAAKGKQSMSMKDGSEAFVGSGDIFQQDPDEVIQAEGGFGGTQSQYAALTTRYGYFFVDQLSRKVFLMKDKLSEISGLGMEGWFRDNMETVLADYDFPTSCGVDNPIVGFGFHSIYDPKYKRIILTKRDLEPTQAFIDGWDMINTMPPTLGEITFNHNTCKYQVYVGCKFTSWPCPDMNETIEWTDDKYFTKGGWTISYYPELGIWGSFHDYMPYIYFNTSTDFYSLTDQYPRPSTLSVDGTAMGNAGIWKHNADRKGILYQSHSNSLILSGVVILHPFEFEFIHNETKGMDTLLSSFNYTSEVFNSAGVNVLEHGFTKFLLYNTFQLSGESDLEYLVNTRRVGNNWKVNHFRDMAALVNQFGALSAPGAPPLPNTSPYYMSTNPNIIGGTNAGTVTTSSIQSMFIVDGMSKNINAGYLDLGKTWNNRRKFIDKWVGIRLIYDNISNNLLNLYSTNVVVRKMYR